MSPIIWKAGETGEGLYHNLPCAHLLGCSKGGEIALDFALAFPERVASFRWR